MDRKRRIARAAGVLLLLVVIAIALARPGPWSPGLLAGALIGLISIPWWNRVARARRLNEANRAALARSGAEQASSADARPRADLVISVPRFSAAPLATIVVHVDGVEAGRLRRGRTVRLRRTAGRRVLTAGLDWQESSIDVELEAGVDTHVDIEHVALATDAWAPQGEPFRFTLRRRRDG